MAREKICTKVYINVDGSEAVHASPEAASLEFRFESGETIVVELGTIAENCVRAATWHGLSQKLGDTYAGKDASDAAEEVQTLLERLQSGDWVKAREGAGPRPTLVSAAIVAALEAEGQTVDQAREKAIHEKVNDPASRKSALANKKISAHYERIKAELAQEKAAKAETAAAGETVNLTAY